MLLSGRQKPFLQDYTNYASALSFGITPGDGGRGSGLHCYLQQYKRRTSMWATPRLNTLKGNHRNAQG